MGIFGKLVSPGFSEGFAKQMSANITARKEQTRKDKIARAKAAKEEAEKIGEGVSKTAEMYAGLAKNIKDMSPKGREELTEKILSFVESVPLAHRNKVGSLLNVLDVHKDISSFTKKTKADEDFKNKLKDIQGGKIPFFSPQDLLDMSSERREEVSKYFNVSDNTSLAKKAQSMNDKFAFFKQVENETKLKQNNRRYMFPQIPSSSAKNALIAPDKVALVFDGNREFGGGRDPINLSGQYLLSGFEMLTDQYRRDANLRRFMQNNQRIGFKIRRNFERLQKNDGIIINNKMQFFTSEKLKKRFPELWSYFVENKELSNNEISTKNFVDANAKIFINSQSIKDRSDTHKKLSSNQFTSLNNTHNTLSTENKKQIKKLFSDGKLPMKPSPLAPEETLHNLTQTIQRNIYTSALNLDSKNQQLKALAEDPVLGELQLYQDGLKIKDQYALAKAFDNFTSGIKNEKNSLALMDAIMKPLEGEYTTNAERMYEAVLAVGELIEYRIPRGNNVENAAGRVSFEHTYESLNFKEEKTRREDDTSKVLKIKTKKQQTFRDLSYDLKNVLFLVSRDEDSENALDQVRFSSSTTDRIQGAAASFETFVDTKLIQISTIAATFKNYVDGDNGIKKLNELRLLENRNLKNSSVRNFTGLNNANENRLLQANNVFNKRLKEFEDDKSLINNPKLYQKKALLEYAKLALTYRLSGMVQGDSTGGRTISNADFEVMFRALWGEQEQVKPKLNALFNKIKFQEAVMTNDIAMLENGSYFHITGGRDLYGLDRFYKTASERFIREFKNTDLVPAGSQLNKISEVVRDTVNRYSLMSSQDVATQIIPKILNNNEEQAQNINKSLSPFLTSFDSLMSLSKQFIDNPQKETISSKLDSTLTREKLIKFIQRFRNTQPRRINTILKNNRALYDKNTQKFNDSGTLILNNIVSYKMLPAIEKNLNSLIAQSSPSE